MSFAVVDQGSSSTKGLLVGRDGSVLDRVRIPIGAKREEDRVEQDGEEILASVEEALRRLRRSHEVEAIGLCCQRSTCLLWDADSGAPRSPALSWQDRRTTALLAAWPDEVRRGVAERTGLRLSPHYAGSKIGWLLDRTEGARRDAERGDLAAGTLDAFLVGRLTGTATTEPGHAGRTLLYDLRENAWSPWLLERFGVPEACLPDLLPSVAGRGDWDGIPVRVVLGDQQAALLGHGSGEDGSVAVHFGTGAFVLVATGDRLVRAPDLLSAVLWSEGEERRFQLEGSVNSAGSAVDWIVERSGFDLDAWAPERFDLDRIPLCVPAFAGLGAPWWKPSARAAFTGLREATTSEDLAAGVVAGIALRVVDNLRALAAAGRAPERVRVSGRLGRLDALGALLADASGCRVERVVEEETGAIGVARLLGAAATPGTDRVWEPAWGAAEREAVRRRWEELVRQVVASSHPPGSSAT